MWTQGQVYVLHAGQSVELNCEFYWEPFNMFKNPVVWKKRQRQEITDVNIMGNILSPFLATGRFVVAFDKSPPTYRMKLRITGHRRPSLITQILILITTRMALGRAHTSAKAKQPLNCNML